MDRALRVLVQAHLVRIPAPARDADARVSKDVLATLVSNVSALGYALSKEAFSALVATTDGAARAWWEELEPVLMDLTGANRKLDEHVVYKNFPREVLALSEADYWLRQILMYWGLPNELVTTPAEPRPALDEPIRGKVLHPEKPDSFERILRDLIDATTRWTNDQRDAAGLIAKRFGTTLDLAKVKFKENMVLLALECLARGVPVALETATDVLRLAWGMSDGDVSLREPSKLRRFKRSERRFLLGLLEGTAHLEADFARRPERAKRLVHALHPGDWAAKFPRVVAAANRLYQDTLPPTDAARVETKIAIHDATVLEDLRAGALARQAHHLILRFGAPAVSALVAALPELTVHRVLGLERYFEKINERRHRTIPPRGNWAKLQILDNSPGRRLANDHLKTLAKAFAANLEPRVRRRVPKVALSPSAALVKLPTNDSGLLPYGRGTVFPLPADVGFLRTASYWRLKGRGNVWFDNGWNFFDDAWQPQGACCYSAIRVGTEKEPGAVFSGDPTNSKDLDGRACQLIDLYPRGLAKLGIRYAVWNVLCYSRLTFDEAEEVFAGLQWGQNPESGKLFDPARTQLAFALKGAQYTKYVALFDVKKNVLVYLDASLPAKTHSASANGPALTAKMPAFVEYLDSLPSVHDALRHSLAAKDGMPATYSDRDLAISGGPAWVFKPENQANRFEPFSLATLLAD